MKIIFYPKPRVSEPPALISQTRSHTGNMSNITLLLGCSHELQLLCISEQETDEEDPRLHHRRGPRPLEGGASVPGGRGLTPWRAGPQSLEGGASVWSTLQELSSKVLKSTICSLPRTRVKKSWRLSPLGDSMDVNCDESVSLHQLLDPSHPETQDPSHPETQDPSHPETQDPFHPETQRPRTHPTQRPRDPGPVPPRDPETQDPSHPETQRPEGLHELKGLIITQHIPTVALAAIVNRSGIAVNPSLFVVLLVCADIWINTPCEGWVGPTWATARSHGS
ncbi:unnamed protein product [Pleuronectes platessa]|uniref:Uncharacterized protein n=1 Tax=Pleuronectes platessa TaxID=8262 RepID=A0A9N7Z9V4_PLEPL|nr:unnamed protein product [Pleuronectes platessa]